MAMTLEAKILEKTKKILGLDTLLSLKYIRRSTKYQFESSDRCNRGNGGRVADKKNCHRGGYCSRKIDFKMNDGFFL
jgi:hypothetical protein